MSLWFGYPILIKFVRVDRYYFLFSAVEDKEVVILACYSNLIVEDMSTVI